MAKYRVKFLGEGLLGTQTYAVKLVSEIGFFDRQPSLGPHPAPFEWESRESAEEWVAKRAGLRGRAIVEYGIEEVPETIEAQSVEVGRTLAELKDMNAQQAKAFHDIAKALGLPAQAPIFGIDVIFSAIRGFKTGDNAHMWLRDQLGDRDNTIAKLNAKVGELTMERDALAEKLERTRKR